MATLKEKSQAILAEKNAKILPENIKAGVQIFDVVGTLDDSSSSSGVKLFETIEEMNNTETAQLNDLAVVYRNEIQNAKVDSKFSKAKFPSTVVLPSVIEDYVEVMYRATDDSIMFDCWGSLDANMFDMSCYTESGSIRIRYESADGITYTRTDSGDETIDFGTEIYYYNTEYWNDAIGYFITLGGMTFEGLYEYKHLEKTEYISFPLLKDIPTINENYDALIINHNSENKFSVSKIKTLIERIQTENTSLVSGSTTLYINTSGELISVWGVREYEGGNYAITFVNSFDYNTRQMTTELSNYGQGFSKSGALKGVYAYKLDLENMSYASYPVGHQLYDYKPNSTAFYHLITNGLNVASVAYRYTSTTNEFYTQYFQGYKDTSTIKTVNITITPSYYYWASEYIVAPTQLTLASANELLPGKVGYGNDGIIVGDGSIYDNLDITKLNEALGINIQVPNYCNIDGINAEVNALYSVVVDEENGEHNFYVPVGALKCPTKEELEALVRENYDDVYDTVSVISAPYPIEGCRCAFILDFKNTDKKHQVYVLFYDFALNTYVSCLRVFDGINAQFSVNTLGLGAYFVSYTGQGKMVITCLSHSTASVTNEIAIAVIDVFEMRVANTNITTMLEDNYIRDALTALKDNVLVVIGIVDNDENIFVMEFDMSNLSVKGSAQSTLSGVTTLHFTSACKMGNDYYIQCYSPNPYTDYLMKYDAASNSITHVVIPSASAYTRYANTTVFTDGTYVYVRPNSSSVYKYSSDLVKQETISHSGSTNLLSNLYYWDFDITDVKNYTCSSVEGRVSVVNGVESLNTVSGIRPTNSLVEDYGGGTGSSLIYGHVPDSGAESLSTYLYYDDKYIIGLQCCPTQVSITKGIHNNASVIMQAKSTSKFNLVSNTLI